MREGVTKYFEFFTPEVRLSVLQGAVLCDGVVSRRRSAGQESQIMIHNTPSRLAVLVTNAVTVILNTKGQTSYWTFVQCCVVRGQLLGVMAIRTVRVRAQEIRRMNVVHGSMSRLFELLMTTWTNGYWTFVQCMDWVILGILAGWLGQA